MSQIRTEFAASAYLGLRECVCAPWRSPAITSWSFIPTILSVMPAFLLRLLQEATDLPDLHNKMPNGQDPGTFSPH